MTRLRALLASLAVLALTAAACSGSNNAKPTASGSELVGLFKIDAGQCETTGAAGSSFRMVQPGGTVSAGPFVANGDSPCADKTWTTLSPGTDGGLRTSAYQAQPGAPFDPNGDSASAAILEPQKFFAVAFGPSTNAKDPQTGASVATPKVAVSGTSLSGDIRAFSVAWNGQQFNQGSPKPDGSAPGGTSPLTGTYDPASHAFTLSWSSQIVGGPFNNFTGTWNLRGTFVPA
ncbi:MAG: hypothetical protein M3159_08335 [Actinomycetota bacterium]|nr:hypothetical protein [Actinomycetota bacterium]